MSGVNEIRTSFLDYFKRNDHTIVPSSPLVPRNDPTLLFTNAGMVQFKNVFTGIEKRPYQRAVTAQKSLRAGGKHNDLDNVGYTARHHTFFEMLGNFSFGDYFKDRAIELAWDLVTREFGLPKERLLVTVYIDDDAAFDLWKKIAGLPESKIIRIAGADNFWAMGETGPCGPCSEIFYDHGEHIAGGPPGSPDAEGDRFIEIWNLVFMQYEQLAGGKRIDLPRPSIDTGMGLERIAAVLQGTHDNYAIDLFAALIRAIADLTGIAPDGPQRASHRVIADHLRASAFLIADGVLPSNEGRGYVLRRIMRRAMRHAELLGAKEPLMWKLVPVLTREMGQAYPELMRAEALITETLKLEETRFRNTLERGLSILDAETKSLKSGDRLKGEVAFTLYDTYGFPLDLTQDALKSRGIAVDTRGLQCRDGKAAREGARLLGRIGRRGGGKCLVRLCATRPAPRSFLVTPLKTRRGWSAAIVRDGQEADVLRKGESGALILNQTPFYGESGGQVGDTGTIAKRQGALSRHRYAKARRRPAGALRNRGGGRSQAGRRAPARSRSRAQKRDPRQSFGDASSPRGAAPGAGRPCRAKGLARRARPAALRLFPSQADQRAGHRAHRGHRQRHGRAEFRRHHACDGGRRRHRFRRARVVRREIRRGGARRRHGRNARRQA